MNGVTFSHPNPDVGDLSIRLAPTSVNWTYSLITNTTNTYDGQVIQLLGLRYDQLTIEGRFGLEGPHGADRNRNGHIADRPRAEYHSLGRRRGGSTNQPFEIGLSQMTQYFRTYFAVAGAGGDMSQKGTYVRGHYDQHWMTLSYQGNIDKFEKSWTVYPVSFPSYSRANDEFAPEWHVEFKVVEPDFETKTQDKLKSIDQLKAGVGYRPMSPYSDPLGALLYDPKTGKPLPAKQITAQLIAKAKSAVNDANDNVFTALHDLLPYSASDVDQLIFFNASVPGIYADAYKKAGIDLTPTTGKQKPKKPVTKPQPQKTLGKAPKSVGGVVN